MREFGWVREFGMGVIGGMLGAWLGVTCALGADVAGEGGGVDCDVWTDVGESSGVNGECKVVAPFVALKLYVLP